MLYTYSIYAIQHICYIAGNLYTMLYSSLLRRAQGVLYAMVYSLVYSLHARCYNVSLIPLPPPLSCLQVALYRPELAGRAAKPPTPRCWSQESRPVELPRDSPSRLADLHQQQGPACSTPSCSLPNPSPFPWDVVKGYEKRSTDEAGISERVSVGLPPK